MKYLFAAAAIVVLAVTPAAAKSKKMVMTGCSGDGPSKMSSAMMTMPFDERMIMMNKSQAEMNMAMSKGDMRGCNKAMMRGQRAMKMKSSMSM